MTLMQQAQTEENNGSINRSFGVNLQDLLNDVSKNMEDLEELLKEAFLTNYESSGNNQEHSKLHNKIIRLDSYRALKFFVETKEKCSTEIFDDIKILYEKFIHYLDSDEREFLSGLKTNFPSRVFELIVANLINKSGYNLLLRERMPGNPDLVTENFLVECTTGNSSFIQDWYDLLPQFDKYYSIVTKLLERRKPNKDEPPHISLNQVWPILKECEIDDFKLILKSSLSSQEIREKIEFWLELNRQIKTYHENLISEKLLEKLNEININGGTSRDINYEFISKRVIEMIICKLQKTYFQNGQGVLAISVGFLCQGLPPSMSETEGLMKYFQENYEKLILKKLGSQSVETQEKILKGLENLVAIIFDTNWYNWFFSILQQNGLAHFSKPEQNNFFYLFYNDKFSDDYKLNQFRSTIHYHQELTFISNKLYDGLKVESEVSD